MNTVSVIRRNKNSTEVSNRTGWHIGNALDLYCVGACFESVPLTSAALSVVFFSRDFSLS